MRNGKFSTKIISFTPSIEDTCTIIQNGDLKKKLPMSYTKTWPALLILEHFKNSTVQLEKFSEIS